MWAAAACPQCEAMAGAGCPLSLASCGAGAHPPAGAGCECPFGRWGAASGAEAMPRGAEGVGITPVRGRCPVASSAGRRVGAGVPQPQFPSCPCGGASSGEKPQCRTARCWVNTTAGTFVPPSPGGTGGRKNALGKQGWSGAAPLPCWDSGGAAGAEGQHPAAARGARLRAAPVPVLLGVPSWCRWVSPGNLLGGGRRLWGGRSGSKAGLAGSCRQGFQVVRRWGAWGWRQGSWPRICAPRCAQCQAPHIIPPTPSLRICPPGVTEGETSLANTPRAICGAPLSLPPSQAP